MVSPESLVSRIGPNARRGVLLQAGHFALYQAGGLRGQRAQPLAERNWNGASLFPANDGAILDVEQACHFIVSEPQLFTQNPELGGCHSLGVHRLSIGATRSNTS